MKNAAIVIASFARSPMADVKKSQEAAEEVRYG
jgi:hypothetical protein